MRNDNHNFELDYVGIIGNVLSADVRATRNSTTKAIFGESLRVHSLVHSKFPVLLGRKMFVAGIVGELATFLRGPTKLSDFTDMGCNYWGNWAQPDGSIAVDYGNKWLDFNGINQIQSVVNSLKWQKTGRRHLITGWDPSSVPTTDLPCCHYAYQWFVDGDMLEMVWTQRSVDVMVGLPSDIVLAALLNVLMAQTVGLKPGSIKMDFGDTHIYTQHLSLVSTYLEEALQRASEELPGYHLDPAATVFNFMPSMFKLLDYDNHGPAIKFELLA